MEKSTGVAKIKDSAALSSQLTNVLTIYEQQALVKLPVKEQAVIVASKERKFKDFTEEDKQKLVQRLLAWMVVLAIKEIPKADDPYWILIANFLIKSFPKLTAAEFDNAIEHNVKRTSEHKERHFQGFGADYLCIMINNYEKEIKEVKFKFNQLASNIEEEANRPVLTEQQKQVVALNYFLHLIEIFKKSGRVNDPTESLYMYLRKVRKAKVREIIKLNKADSVMDATRARIKNELIVQREAAVGSMVSLKVRTELKNIEHGTDKTTEAYVKAQALNMYCEIILSNINIDDLETEIQTELTTIK